ncbi:4Fe-4S ferredoxin iron-sulfur binding domain-containing protein [Desulfofundulus kuznetsovii DSM 6115]|uniref:4Fe-4S ferredoxin iron-sulfur binding domain-containing protein n=1 Tax=Desulfofundulus kuznetsovii (strain DSM 6115 / VKM B-1805 / 17) TaxID=760568 RepID=A0AAU8PFM6_DESK7|nr:4Fe-4S ferredoxin iron-sulfur binding domain-containing protein [Desulfofundulus kuznetsovii DSM 6115]
MEAKLKDFLRAQGAELVGISAVENIPDYHPPRNVNDIIPGARSVIVMAIPMLSGAIKCSSSRVATTQTKGMFEQLYRLSYQAGRYLERLGYRAAPIAPQIPIEMSRETKGFSGDLSLKHLAVAA